MSIELSGINVLISIGLLAICVIIFILLLRKVYRLRKDKNAINQEFDSIQNRNKYHGVNTLKNVGMNLKLGFVCSLAFVLLSFSWTTYDPVVLMDWDEPTFDDVIPITPPPTDHRPPPPPPPPPVIEPVTDDLIEEDDELEFVDESVEDDTVIDYAPIAEPAKEVGPAPRAVYVEKEEIDEIIYIAESMPRFPGCEDLSGSKNEKKACADKKMLEYIYTKLKYPVMARDNDIEGTVVIQFVVSKEGTITDVNVVRKLGGGCSEAAAKVVREMNSLPDRWTPGKQMGKKVRVMYTLPIKFKLLK